jgi:hypothetical protein
LQNTGLEAGLRTLQRWKAGWLPESELRGNWSWELGARDKWLQGGPIYQTLVHGKLATRDFFLVVWMDCTCRLLVMDIDTRCHLSYGDRKLGITLFGVNQARNQATEVFFGLWRVT